MTICTASLDAVRSEVSRRLSRDRLRRVISLVEGVRLADGSRPLSDHLWIDLQAGGGDGFIAVLLEGDRDTASGALAGYAQASSTNDRRSIEIVVPDDDPTPGAHAAQTECTRGLLTAILREIALDGGDRVDWWVHDPEPWHTELAASVGLRPGRELLQMQRSLPTGRTVTMTTRPFRPGTDDLAWLDVNNRAFAHHGEQGGWDLETLHRRVAEPWFDPDGFLVLELDGRLVGSCWTKLHLDTEPPVGEIYVISVDPDIHGRGLGAQLTLAGLEAIHASGITVGMLYVDAHNTTAVRLYRKLGFEVTRTDRAYTGTVAAHAARSTRDETPNAQR